MKKFYITLVASFLACGFCKAQNTPWPSTTSSDNVGIGTTSPQSKLEVSSPSSNYASSGIFHLNGGQGWGHVLTLATDNVNGDDARLLFSYRNKSKQWALGGNFNTSRFSIWEDGGNGIYGSEFGIERLTVLPGGNVGIGVNNPNARLEVQGTFLTSGNDANIDAVIPGKGDLSYLANSGRMLIGWNRSQGAGETDFISNQGGGGNGGFAFYNYNNNNQQTQLMWIRGDGNVGIGTTDPKGYKLAVAGNAIAESITVKLQSAWPDYVFKPTYHLPSLTSVKAYIDKNQHLPEMPSEVEVAKEGVNLGEINKLLVKKVEELTLYLIEKDKQLSSQQKQNEKQDSRIAALEKALKSLKK